MLCLPPEKDLGSADAPPRRAGADVKLNETPAARPGEQQATQMLRVLVIVLAGLLVYAPAFHGLWLWDDDQEVTSNPLLRDPMGVFKAWGGSSGADYFPLKTTVQWVLWRVLKDNATGYHLANVALHLASCLLLWQLLARLRVRHAWLGGLIFAIHPVLVESVAWISELKNTLSLPLVLLALLSWLKFTENGRAAHFFAALGLYAAAALCKTSVVMFPFVLLLYAWWRNGDLGKKDIQRTIPFFLVSLGLGLITVYFQHDRAIGGENLPVGGPLSRLAIAGQAIAFYTWKSILPFDLLPIYPRWPVDAPLLVQFLPWPALAIVLFWLWSKRGSWGRHVLLGYGFFLINLFPVLGFVKMSYMRITWVADHFIYLPMVGVVGLVAVGIGELYDRAASVFPRWALACGLGLMGWMVMEGHRYAGVFANEVEMWSYTLARNPDAWQAHSRYGRVLAQRGRNNASFYHIEQSVRLRPDLAETHNNYSTMLEAKGRLDEALTEMREAHRIQPEIPIYTSNLAGLLIRMEKYVEGARLLEELLKTAPSEPTLLSNYGVALYHLGRREEAMAFFKQALHFSPDLEDAATNLNFVLQENAEIAEIGYIMRNPTEFFPPDVDLNSGSAIPFKGIDLKIPDPVFHSHLQL